MLGLNHLQKAEEGGDFMASFYLACSKKPIEEANFTKFAMSIKDWHMNWWKNTDAHLEILASEILPPATHNGQLTYSPANQSRKYIENKFPEYVDKHHPEINFKLLPSV